MQELPKECSCFGATATCSDAFAMTVLMDNKGWLALMLRVHDLLRIANSLCIPAVWPCGSATNRSSVRLPPSSATTNAVPRG